MADAGELRIEWMRLDDLVPARRNSRVHDLPALGDAVDRLGFTTELKIDEASGELIWGHGRRDLLRRKRDAGEDAPEGIRVAADGEWLAPVVRGWSSRNPLHADAVREADNTQGEKGSYDAAIRLDVLSDLAAEDPDLLAGVGVDSDYLDRLMAEASGGATITTLDGLGTALMPVDSDPFSDRPRAPEGDDEQWGSGSSPDEGSSREEETPGPLDVEPAWRTIEPMRARYHDGTPDGADRVARWLRSHATDVHVDHQLAVTWRGRDGEEYLPPGKWVVRYRGQLSVMTREEKDDEFVPANEPARRVDRDAKPVAGSKTKIPPAADLLRHGKGVLTSENVRVALAGQTDAP